MAGRPKGLPKTGGRVKGQPNKTTQSAKEAIAAAAESLGGSERLTKWAQEAPENERVFWGTIYPKLLPLVGSKENPFAGKLTLALKPRSYD